MIQASTFRESAEYMVTFRTQSSQVDDFNGAISISHEVHRCAVESGGTEGAELSKSADSTVESSGGGWRRVATISFRENYIARNCEEHYTYSE